ncbi:MAG TPA: hypothetical protein VE975_08055 [Actinomycetota bacterium]|nr:hypothetical protein [Actinomycetota bacterium]
MGASAADALTIVTEAGGTSFKLANVTSPVGVVDQDRTSGIRSLLGHSAPLVPVRTVINVPSLGETRVGETEISPFLPEDYMSWFTAVILFSHMDAAMDAVSGGSSAVEWSISGANSSGQPWTLKRSDRFVDDDDISLASAKTLYFQLEALRLNPFRDPQLSAIDLSATMQPGIRRFDVAKALISVDGSRFAQTQTVKAHPGSRIAVRALLRPYREDGLKKVDLTVRVPRTARKDASIGLRGMGGGSAECPGCYGNFDSFDDFISSMQLAPVNNELKLSLRGAGSVRATSYAPCSTASCRERQPSASGLFQRAERRPGADEKPRLRSPARRNPRRPCEPSEIGGRQGDPKAGPGLAGTT